MSIDEIDGKILKELLINGRKSFVKIASDMGVSEDIIWQHYVKLKKDQIILGSTIQLNYDVLGYKTVGAITVSVLSEKKEKIVTKINEIQCVCRVRLKKIEPKIRVIVTLKKLEEMEIITHMIKQIPGVVGIKTEIWMGIRNMVDNLSVLVCNATSKSKLKRIKENEAQLKKHKKIDQLDKKIIDKLDKNGRMPYNKIAQEIGVSTDTVSRRFKKLTKNNIIKPLIQIDPSKLGYVARAQFNIAFSCRTKLSTLVDLLSQIPDITLIIKTSGKYDLYVRALLRNIKQLFSIENEMIKICGISEISVHIEQLLPKMPSHSQYISTF